jgi:hypothetical protein
MGVVQMFSEQNVQMDGSVDCLALIDAVHDYVKNELAYASPADQKLLLPLWNVRVRY